MHINLIKFPVLIGVSGRCPVSKGLCKCSFNVVKLKLAVAVGQLCPFQFSCLSQTGVTPVCFFFFFFFFLHTGVNVLRTCLHQVSQILLESLGTGSGAVR